MIKRALISVSNKAGIVDFAKGLAKFGIEIISTGGTARALKEAGLKVKDVSEYTGFPEMMGGRLKTLHPNIHGGLLGRRDKPEDLKEMASHGIEPIDMVVVNLYPFKETISREGVTFEEAIENIDIGGPTMLRAASKNFTHVTVIVDPQDYSGILKEMDSSQGNVGRGTNLRLAQKVFAHTSSYDAAIASYLCGEKTGSDVFSSQLYLSYEKVCTLRYGENPHQKAAFYKEATEGLSLASAKLLQGKEMSFNNYLDTHSALALCLEFDKPACVIVKHNNPCGVAIGENPKESYKKALQVDPVSAFMTIGAPLSRIYSSACR